MRATLFVDVLSHWCLAAMPAVHALADLTPNVEIVYCPVNNGEPMGVSAQAERWFYSRGALAYGRTMRSDWYESDTTTTWFANAVAYVGGTVTGQPIRAAHSVMSAAMEQGQMLGRANLCYEMMAHHTGRPASEIGRLVGASEVKTALDAGNRRLAEIGSDERPTFVLENDIGNRILLKGMWHKELVVASALALLHDERAYRMAGPSPF